MKSSSIVMLLYYIFGLQIAQFVDAEMSASRINIVRIIQNHFHSGYVVVLESNMTYQLSLEMGIFNSNKNSDLSETLRSMYRIQTTLPNIAKTLRSFCCGRSKPIIAITSSVPSIAILLAQVSKLGLLSLGIWLIFLDVDNIEQLFKGVDIPINSLILVVKNTECRWTFYEVYRVAPDLPMRSLSYGEFSHNKGLSCTKELFYERRRNLAGLVITAGYNIDGSLTLFQKFKNGTAIMDGFSYHIWKTLEERLNFTTVYAEVINNSWGVRSENGSWNGMVGSILRNEIDVAIGVFGITTIRSTVVDFFVPFLNSRSLMYFRSSDKDVSPFNTYLRPFSLELWIAVILTMIVLAACVTVAQNIKCRFDRNQHSLNTKHNICDSLFYVFTTLCQKGIDDTPNTTSSRIIYQTSYVMSVVLVASYSAYLTSYLATREKELPFSDFREFLETRNYKLEVGKISYEWNFFNESRDPVIHEIYRKFLSSNKENFPETTAEGIQRACDIPKYAYIVSEHFAEVLLKSTSCKLDTLIKDYIPLLLSMIARKKFPYKDIINHELESMRRDGIIHRLYQLHYPRKEIASSQKWIDTELAHIVPLLILLSGGILSATVLLIIERIMANLK